MGSILGSPYFGKLPYQGPSILSVCDTEVVEAQPKMQGLHLSSQSNTANMQRPTARCPFFEPALSIIVGKVFGLKLGVGQGMTARGVGSSENLDRELNVII